MKCLRIYATADAESHFDEVDIPTRALRVHRMPRRSKSRVTLPPRA
jgi:hypothetical protein